jgi:glycosyltransferase involved in cell wall biosynthesis
MKIVITTFTYYPNLDGVAEATRFLAESLAELGHEIVVITSITHDERLESLHNKLRIVRYKLVNSHFLSCVGDPSETDRYRKSLLKENPDLLICACWDAWPTVLGLPVLKKLSCPKILVSHGFSSHLKPRSAPPPFFGFGQWWHGIIWTANYIPKLIKAFDRFIFLAHRKDTKRFIDHSVMSFIDSDMVRIIPNSPNLEPFSDLPNDFREHYGIKSGLMILCVANFSERKNQELAVNSFFETDIPGSTLVCIGSEKNDYFDKVSALVRKKESSHPDQKVFLLNGMTRVDTMKAYAACDMTLLTAHQETQPIVLIESMAFSKPWIATSSGCIMEMEGGVPVNSSQELVNWLKKLMADPDLTARLGVEGRSAFERRYQQTTVKAQWKKLIDEVSPNAPSL